MPTFHFVIVQDCRRIEQQDGIEFPTVDADWIEATTAISELMPTRSFL